MPGFVAFVLWMLLLGFTVHLIVALGAGQLKADGVTVTRTRAPRAYWFEIGLSAWMIAGSGAALLVARPAWPVLFLALFPIHPARLVWYGRVHTWRGTFTRREWPRRYWTELGLHLFMIVLILIIIVLDR